LWETHVAKCRILGSALNGPNSTPRHEQHPLLKTFTAVAAEGSFARRARVALTQAAVGQQMRGLEPSCAGPCSSARASRGAQRGRPRAVPQVRRLLALYEQMLAPARATGSMAGTVHLAPWSRRCGR
jgi:hypothetical protein